MSKYNPKPQEFDYLITPDGLQYQFHDGTGYFLLANGQEGLGHAPYHRIEQRGPYQHGTSVIDYRLDPRTLTFMHWVNGCDRDEYWDIRSDIINYTRINRQAANSFLPFKLAKVLPDESIRYLDVYPEPFQFSALDRSRWNMYNVDGAIRFYAGDPTLYNPTATVLTVEILVCDDLIFPFQFPFIFCGGGIAQTDTITYTGTWLAYPTIRITGPAENAIIVNVTTSKRIAFTRTIPDGTTITIDLRYGYKTVTSDNGENWIGYLTTDSDLTGFYLAPDPEAPGGVNVISASALGVANRTRLEMEFYTRYVGI